MKKHTDTLREEVNRMRSRKALNVTETSSTIQTAYLPKHVGPHRAQPMPRALVGHLKAVLYDGLRKVPPRAVEEPHLLALVQLGASLRCLRLHGDQPPKHPGGSGGWGLLDDGDEARRVAPTGAFGLRRGVRGLEEGQDNACECTPSNEDNDGCAMPGLGH